MVARATITLLLIAIVEPIFAESRAAYNAFGIWFIGIFLIPFELIISIILTIVLSKGQHPGLLKSFLSFFIALTVIALIVYSVLIKMSFGSTSLNDFSGQEMLNSALIAAGVSLVAGLLILRKFRKNGNTY